MKRIMFQILIKYAFFKDKILFWPMLLLDMTQNFAKIFFHKIEKKNQIIWIKKAVGESSKIATRKKNGSNGQLIGMCLKQLKILTSSDGQTKNNGQEYYGQQINKQSKWHAIQENWK